MARARERGACTAWSRSAAEAARVHDFDKVRHVHDLVVAIGQLDDAVIAVNPDELALDAALGIGSRPVDAHRILRLRLGLLVIQHELRGRAGG